MIASVAHAVHWVYLAALPMAVLTIACAWMIRELPLKSRSSMAETGPTD